jgi:hypothetical protein
MSDTTDSTVDPAASNPAASRRNWDIWPTDNPNDDPEWLAEADRLFADRFGTDPDERLQSLVADPNADDEPEADPVPDAVDDAAVDPTPPGEDEGEGLVEGSDPSPSTPPAPDYSTPDPTSTPPTDPSTPSGIEAALEAYLGRVPTVSEIASLYDLAGSLQQLPQDQAEVVAAFMRGENPLEDLRRQAATPPPAPQPQPQPQPQPDFYDPMDANFYGQPQPQPQPTPDPRLDQMAAQLDELTRAQTTQAELAAQREYEQYQQQVAAAYHATADDFRSRHPFLDDNDLMVLEARMHRDSQIPTDLARHRDNPAVAYLEAFDRNLWADPKLRQKAVEFEQRRQAEAQDVQVQAQRQNVSSALAGGAGTSSAPTAPPATPSSPTPQTGSRDPAIEFLRQQVFQGGQ